MAKLFRNMARSSEECYSSLEAVGQKLSPGYENGTLWCNATWDSVLCWPAIPANTSFTMGCPPLKGLDTEKEITKRCHSSGHWAGRDDSDFTSPSENITKHCHGSGRWLGKTSGDFSRPQGWTNFSSCMTPVVKEILDLLGADAMKKAQQIAKGLRKMEFVGLTLSFVSLVTAIGILVFYRRLRVFRNQIHVQLMLAILLTVIIRLVLYIDLSFTEQLGSLQAADVAYTINTTKIVCEAFYFILEYGKTVAFAWMFIEGFYLHNTVVVAVFQEAPKLYKYLLIGWGIPLIHVTVWLMVFVTRREIERCLGLYYLHEEFWIMDAVRLTELVSNTGFLLNIVRVLWYKVKDAYSANESPQLKKSVRAALMLIPLLGIPNIMQTIPFTPTRHNITLFAVFTYIASFFYMFQGFMIAVVYCFTNREVINVIKCHYQRYRLQHCSASSLRRVTPNGRRRPYSASYCGQRPSVPDVTRPTAWPWSPLSSRDTPLPSLPLYSYDGVQQETMLVQPASALITNGTGRVCNGHYAINRDQHSALEYTGSYRHVPLVNQEHRKVSQ